MRVFPFSGLVSTIIGSDAVFIQADNFYKLSEQVSEWLYLEPSEVRCRTISLQDSILVHGYKYPKFRLCQRFFYDLNTLKQMSWSDIVNTTYRTKDIRLSFEQDGTVLGLYNNRSGSVVKTDEVLRLINGITVLYRDLDDDEYVKRMEFYDHNLDFLWTRELTDQSYVDFSYYDEEPCCQAYIANDLLIFPIIYEDSQGLIQNAVKALSVKNGEDVWEFSQAKKCKSLWVESDQVTVVLGKTVYLLDAQTGALEHQLDPIGDTDIPLIAQHDDEFLYCIPQRGLPLRVYNRSGTELIKVVDMPTSLGLRTDQFMVTQDDVLYLSVYSTTGLSFALMVLDKAELRSSNPMVLEFEEKPDIDIQCVKHIDDEDHYDIVVRGDDLAKVRRYSEIAVLDVLSRYTRLYYDYPEEYNEDFNGDINLTLAGIQPEQRTEETADRIRNQVFSHFMENKGMARRTLRTLNINWID